MRDWLRLAALVSVATFGPGLAIERAHAFPSRAAFPAALDEYLSKTAKVSDAERADLAAGKPIAKLLDADQNKENAVFGAVWGPAAAPEQYARRGAEIQGL